MSAIPAPAMPPKRPSSSIQQVVTEARHDAEAGAASAPAEQGAGKATEHRTPSAAPAQRESITKPAAAALPPLSPRAAGAEPSASSRQRRWPRWRGYKKPILLKLDENLKERMVNTMEWTSPRTGIRNQQVFIRRAIADLCERLEKEHNSGQPFPVIVDALEA